MGAHTGFIHNPSLSHQPQKPCLCVHIGPLCGRRLNVMKRQMRHSLAGTQRENPGRDKQSSESKDEFYSSEQSCGWGSVMSLHYKPIHLLGWNTASEARKTRRWPST